MMQSKPLFLKKKEKIETLLTDLIESTKSI
jgi:hypothetical protein